MDDAWAFQGRQYQPGAASQILAELGAPRLFSSLPLASTLLAFCIFTTTFTSQIATLCYLRLILAFPCCALWLTVAFPPGIPPGQDVIVYTVLASLGMYGMMKTLDICVVGYWDTEEDVPRWIVVREMKEKHNRTTSGTPATSSLIKIAQPLPSTLQGRLAYAFDALLSMRGASLFTDYVWDWAPEEIWTYRCPPSNVLFIKSRLWDITYGIIALDIAEAVFATRKWDTNSPIALTGYGSTLAQCIHSGSMGLLMYFGGFVPWDCIAIILVPLTGMNPQGWVPFWGPPLQTSSIADFWARRWHTLFRRVFVRLSLPVHWVLHSHKNDKMIRVTTGFILSTILHLLVPMGIPRDGNHYLVFLQQGTIKFFLSQPLGILIESVFVSPLTETWPHKVKIATRRGFTWGWIVWTGGWYMDGFIPDGQLDKQASPFGFTTILCRKLGLYY